MIAKLIPVVMAVAGLGAGIGAGTVLRPVPEADASAMDHNATGDVHAETGYTHKATVAESAPAHHDATEFAAMSNQFVFPLVSDGDVNALVVLSLTLEVTEGATDAAFLLEPKLRDRFLRVMLDHANAGGFRGAFTANDSMERLRTALIEKARETLGDTLVDVLILDINRQDV